MSKILYIGHYKEQSGWAKAAHGYILAMDSVGLNVVPRPLKLNASQPEIPERILELEKESSRGSSICIQHVLPHHLDYNGNFDKNIALCVYETFGGNTTGWDSRINCMDELWTSSEYSAKCFKSMGVKVPIKLVGHAFDMSRYTKEYTKIEHPEINGNFIFYTIADMDKRKNLNTLIKAFHLAFTPNEPVKLMVKTSKYGMSPAQCEKVFRESCEQIKKTMKLYRRIEDYSSEIVVTDHLTDDEIMNFHTTGHCFVTCSHGEAFCIPAFDATAYGKPTISPKGMLDFVEPWNLEVSVTSEPVFGLDTFHEVGSSREVWKDVNTLRLAEYLRVVYMQCRSFGNTAFVSESKECKRICDKYSYESIGNKIKRLLEV